MNVFDILFYLSWTYLSSLIIFELFVFDIPVRTKNDLKNKDAKINKAVAYYLNRKNVLLYKITPIFCLMQVIAIIANIVMQYEDFLVSAISILVLAVLLVNIQTKKNVTVVMELKKYEDTDIVGKEKKLTSVFIAHLITQLILVAMLACYLFKF